MVSMVMGYSEPDQTSVLSVLSYVVLSPRSYPQSALYDQFVHSPIVVLVKRVQPSTRGPPVTGLTQRDGCMHCGGVGCFSVI